MFWNGQVKGQTDLLGIGSFSQDFVKIAALAKLFYMPKKFFCVEKKKKAVNSTINFFVGLIITSNAD